MHGRLLENFNLTGRLLGELAVSNRITINSLVATPEYMQLRGALFDVLRPHPEIRREVVRVLGRLEGQMTAVGGGLVQLIRRRRMALLRDIRLLFDVDEFAEAAGLEGPLDGWQRRVWRRKRARYCWRARGR